MANMPIENPNWDVEIEAEIEPAPADAPGSPHPDREMVLKYRDYVALIEALDAGRVDEAAAICDRFRESTRTRGQAVTARIRDIEAQQTRPARS